MEYRGFLGLDMKDKKIFVVISLVFVVAIIICCVCLWFEFYHIGDLILYKYETIDRIYTSSDVMYFITSDGYGYVSGGWASSDNRDYINTEGRILKGTNLSTPVRIFDQKVRELSPYDGGVLIITEQNELFSATDNCIVKCADNVNTAIYRQNTKQIFVIDQENNLSILCEDGCFNILKQNVKQILSYNNQLYVLNLFGDLSVIILDEDANILSEEQIYSDVKLFDVNNASSRFEDGKIVDSDLSLNYDNALFVVLLTSNQLYCRGIYHPFMEHRDLVGQYPDIITIEDWTLIGEDIVEFSSSAMATIMIDKTGEIRYYGFDTTRDTWLGFIELDIEDVQSVVCENSYVCVKTNSQKWLFWGDSWTNQFCAVNNNDRVISSIYKDAPSIFDPNYYKNN